MVEDIKDTTKVDVTDKGNDKGDKEDKPSPIDQGEFDKAKGDAKALADLLEDHGFGSTEDLTQALSSGKDLKEILGDADAKELLSKAKTLDGYEQHWAKQDQQKTTFEDEDSDEKVTRLERKIESFEKSQQEKDLRQSALQESQEALTSFNAEIKGLVEKNEAISEDYRSFVGEFLGVENLANEIDITKPAEIRKMAREGMKKIQDFEQAVIKRYREGKLEVPEMTKTEPVEVEGIKELKPKNIAESKKMMGEILTKQFLGKA